MKTMSKVNRQIDFNNLVYKKKFVKTAFLVTCSFGVIAKTEGGSKKRYSIAHSYKTSTEIFGR